MQLPAEEERYLFEMDGHLSMPFSFRCCNCHLYFSARGRCYCHPNVFIRKGSKFQGNNGGTVSFLINKIQINAINDCNINEMLLL